MFRIKTGGGGNDGVTSVILEIYRDDISRRLPKGTKVSTR